MSVRSTLDRNFEPLNLDRLKDLFRDESGYEQFVAVIASSFRSATCPVFAGGKIIGVALSPENAKDLLFDRVVECWSKDPSILDRLGQALADDDLIPADDLEDAP
jgi:hypothetical protein